MISLILATLGSSLKDLERLFNSLDNQRHTNFELIIVSQDNHTAIRNLVEKYSFQVKHVTLNKRGLSLARNEGLKHVTGEIFALTDDDCWYKEDSLEYINNLFIDESKEIVCLQHMDPLNNKFPKNYPAQPEGSLSKRRLLQQSSIDIFVHTYRVPDFNIGFDEDFGLGAKYNSGEENIYLMDLYKKGYKISYIPKVISYHPYKEKRSYIDEKTLLGKAPLFKRLFGHAGFFALLAFIFKKFSLIKNKRAILIALREYFDYEKTST